MARLLCIGWVLGLTGLGCAPQLELPGGERGRRVAIMPVPVRGVTSRSIRIEAEDAEPRLFSGTVSERVARGLSQGETSDTLARREVPLVAWGRNDAGDAGRSTTPPLALWLPRDLLAPGETYTLVVAGDRVEFSTLTDELALERVWPRQNVTSRAVFCQGSSFSAGPLGDPSAVAEEQGLVFGETRQDAGASDAPVWTRLAHSPPCWLWQAHAELLDERPETAGQEAPSALAQMPGVAVQPTWPGSEVEQPPTPRACDATEVSIGFACARVEDDRVHVSGGEASAFCTVEGDARGWFVLEPGRTGVIRGLEPERRQELQFNVHFVNVPVVTHSVTLAMGSVRPHVVINEVMADPVGSEPDQEWVELYNDGDAAVNLEGWKLRDENGEIPIPAAWLAPSGYALLVNDTYVSDAVGEPVPEPNASLIRLPMLAKSGISNGGEALRLVDKSDMVVASFPGTPEPAPGISVARGAPWQADESSAFGQHAAPGASPGAPNRLRAGAD